MSVVKSKLMQFLRENTFRRRPWLYGVLVGVILLAAILMTLGLLGILQEAWFRSLPGLVQAGLWAEFILLLLFGYLAIQRLRLLYTQRRHTLEKLDETQRLLQEAYQRMETIFRLNQHFADAENEKDLLDPVLRLLANLPGMKGAAFVPLDEHDQPQAAFSFGELAQADDFNPAMLSWVEYLASPSVRERCKVCEHGNRLDVPANCPQLSGPFADFSSVICLPVRRGEREYGVTTLFLDPGSWLDERARMYLTALMEGTALGLESLRLRQQELAALQQVQALRQKADLVGLLQDLLDTLRTTLEADYAALTVPQKDEAAMRLSSGDLELPEGPAAVRPFIEALFQGVMTSGEAILLGNVSGGPLTANKASGGLSLRTDGLTPPTGLRSLAAAPLLANGKTVVGAVLVGSRRAQGFLPRQLAVLQTLAGQAGVLVQNASLLAELEYQTMIQERTRLAREIHDGLAQILGFLKLHIAQMRVAIGRRDYSRLPESVDLLYSTVTEAYQDARQAIDGLRISPADSGLAGWLAQLANDFEDVSGIPVELLNQGEDVCLASEIQAQLVRVVQEALNNVRKHANATQVWLGWKVERALEVVDQPKAVACASLVVEVRDNGNGFTLEDVSSSSQHGLRGMRERAALIGANVEVFSRPQAGTVIRLHLPLPRLEESSLTTGDLLATGVQG